MGTAAAACSSPWFAADRLRPGAKGLLFLTVSYSPNAKAPHYTVQEGRWVEGASGSKEATCSGHCIVFGKMKDFITLSPLISYDTVKMVILMEMTSVLSIPTC